MKLTNKQDLTNLLDKIKAAISYEEKADYTNAQGREKDFASFMTEACASLASLNPHWVKCQEDFIHYPAMQLPARLKLLQRIKENLNKVSLVNLGPAKQQPKILPQKPLSEIKLSEVPNVNEKTAALVAKLGIFSVEDLLRHWPRNHLDFREKKPIKDLLPGDEGTVIGIVKATNVFTSPRNPKLRVISIKISDASGSLGLQKFIAGNAAEFLARRFLSENFPLNALVMVSGRIQQIRGKPKQMTNFSAEVLEEGSASFSLEVGRIVPIYPLTEGLPQSRFRRFLHDTLTQVESLVAETLPAAIMQRWQLSSALAALWGMHFPETVEALEEARSRTAFEEFMLLQWALQEKNQQSSTNQDSAYTTRPIVRPNLVQDYLAELPFTLTVSQERSLGEIGADLASGQAMNRLLQGDVGSGKTVLAVLSMLSCMERGAQAALMAPTEILSGQHYRKIKPALNSLGLNCALLTGSLKTAQRKAIQMGLADGSIQAVIGTHALIQTGVSFSDLGLVVIDEQHRFGVKQRESLRGKADGLPLHCLFMSATPIPRTMALALYGNLKVSELRELPPGRQPIQTKVVQSRQRNSAYQFVLEELRKGRQAYIIYPLIEASETLTARSLIEEAEKMAKVFAGFQLGIIHGKLEGEEKTEIMKAFQAGELQVLLGTTVLEVGVDVSNATVMIIENAERFGLAQLHQLRGRVGRGSEKSYCLLFSEKPSVTGLERLQVLESSQDGFLIAQKDLEMRGAGDLLGTRQSGLSDFALRNLILYGHLLERAREEVQAWRLVDPEGRQMPAAFLRLILRRQAQHALVEAG